MRAVSYRASLDHKAFSLNEQKESILSTSISKTSIETGWADGVERRAKAPANTWQ